MSDTIKGGKPAGYEFWSKRPAGQGGRGKYWKMLTHRAERHEGTKEVRKELKRGNEE